MHSAWTIFSVLLASSVQTALGRKYVSPIGVGENPNCLGGSYTEYVAKNNLLCTGECWNQPAGQCQTGCTTRNQQYCADYCMAINNCDDCVESLKQMGAGGSEDNWRDACNQEGDSYYCDA